MLQWPPILAKVQPHQRVQVTKRGSGICKCKVELLFTCVDMCGLRDLAAMASVDLIYTVLSDYRPDMMGGPSFAVLLEDIWEGFMVCEDRELVPYQQGHRTEKNAMASVNGIHREVPNGSLYSPCDGSETNLRFGANVSCIDKGVASKLGCARMPSKVLILGISGSVVLNTCAYLEVNIDGFKIWGRFIIIPGNEENIIFCVDILADYHCKVRFPYQKFPILGHVISENCVEPATDKIKAVKEIPIPKNVEQDLNSVLDLGRGSNSKNILQSPLNHKSHSLKIIQCNLNGIGTRGSRIKLEEMLHRAEERKADVICIQETKLRPEKALKLNGYKLIRKDRAQGRGGYIETINSLQNEITQRNQAQEYLMENNELENKINLSKLSAQVRQKANQLKQRKWRDICSNLDPHTRDTKLWKLIKSINQETPYSTTSNTFTDKDGNVLTERTQISNLFADYYTQISKLNFTRQDKKVLHISKKIRNEAKTTSHQDLFHKPFLPHELKEAINRLDDNKTPGSDISAKMIKHLETNAILELFHIINLSWSSSTLPKEWKHAIIIPIHKAGKIENHPQSYRPISLTSIPCKLMERMILNRMQYFLNKNKSLTKQQAAFKKYHNTVDQIFYFTQKIQDNFQSKPTKSTIAAFIDLSQAFDRVWKGRLIKKLDKLGIRGKMMGWIGSFLTGRTFQVNFKEQLSKTGRLFQGLPQGSILSPLLFSIYLNDMGSRITKYCDFALYADDIIIWSSKRDLKEANKNVNKALKELQHFAEKMDLISTRQYRDTLRQTYLALIRQILEYAQPVWQTASKTNLNKIDQVQSSAARIICGLRNTCPTKIAEIEANLLPLTHRRKIGLADYIYKRVNAPKSHRTGEFIRKWKPKTRLKRLSPMHLAYRELLPNSTRNRNAQNQYAPYKERPEISYNLDLEQECSKRADHPGLLRSLAMERIEKADRDHTDIHRWLTGGEWLLWQWIFRSELTAILQALKLVEKNETKNIIIYTDSKAAIFAIKNCYYSQDRLLTNIAAEINKLNKNTKISLQWIPSHVGVPGNEEADRLAKEGAAGHPDAVNSETYLSARDHINKLKLQLIRNHRDSFHHSWYQAENPKKQTLQLNRRESTQLARWKSGHLRPLVYKEGAKSFPMCTRCKTEEATPQHLLNCIGKDKRSLYREPRRVLELLYEHDLQDLV
ncbi:hypothetical protein LAZ67_X003521 [Cordylochernes scorpioides]|uniref:Reverse transcriptase n=1 Tax=Cordylochernes scorpioides TaxID=51811 RepID=A0ABY6LU64_9ARAC|nr:hypothetical protein LAZ67_X003521 [Cordylochernes scorpioides]